MTTPPLRQQGRITLVTGASRGLGRAVARRLAAEGGHVIGLARTQGGLEELDDAIRADGGGSASLVVADLEDADGVDRLGAALYERFGRLDGLAACAGLLGALSPVAHVTPEMWNELVAVNLTANFRLIRAMDPLLRASPAGRATFVTCEAGRAPRAFWSAYAATKAGLEALVTGYAGETAASALRVSLFDPGPMRTALRSKAVPGEDPANPPAPDEVAPALADLLDPASEPPALRVDYAERRSSSLA